MRFTVEVGGENGLVLNHFPTFAYLRPEIVGRLTIGEGNGLVLNYLEKMV